MFLDSPTGTFNKILKTPCSAAAVVVVVYIHMNRIQVATSEPADICNQTSKMAEQDTPPPTITAMKIAIIKKGEYDIWSMRMRQYICHTKHYLWDVIVNGDLEEEAAPSGEQSAPPAPKTAKQLAAKRN
ncbi:hypothetical protein Tco_0996616 [Tanacetum coccineum]